VSPEVKALPLGGSGGAVPLTRETVTESSYPLARGVYIYINRPAKKAIDPKVSEFLRFVLSDEGQAVVERQGDFLPLSPAVAAEQRKKLE
jgi:phosphate transport system substrate-binding protein